MTFRPNLRIRNQYLKELGPSATLRAIRMCLRPTVINRDNTPRLLISLGCASGINFTLGIIPQLIRLVWSIRLHKCMNGSLGLPKIMYSLLLHKIYLCLMAKRVWFPNSEVQILIWIGFYFENIHTDIIVLPLDRAFLCITSFGLIILIISVFQTHCALQSFIHSQW